MTQAFNLSQLGNNINSSGQVSMTAGVTGTLPIANGGTNATATPTLGGVIVGTGTAYSSTAAGTSGYFLQSNGSAAPTWAIAGGGLGGTTVFTSSGTFTIPAGKTVVKVTVQGGGASGAGCGVCGQNYATGGGGGGGTAIKYLTGLTPGNTLTVTVGVGTTGGTGVGTAGNTSSVASGTQSITTISATGGGAGTRVLSPSAGFASSSGGTGGAGTNGDVNISGGTGFTGLIQKNSCNSLVYCSSGTGGSSFFGYGGIGLTGTGDSIGGATPTGYAGINGISYGAGASGGWFQSAGANGIAGIVIFEY